jgi:hypothetical protein
MLSFVNKEQGGAKLFTAKCVAMAKESREHNELLQGWFLVWLDKIIQQNWTIASKECDNEDLLEDQMSGEDVDSLLKGSHGAIFYFAGCTHSGWCPK